MTQWLSTESVRKAARALLLSTKTATQIQLLHADPRIPLLLIYYHVPSFKTLQPYLLESLSACNDATMMMMVYAKLAASSLEPKTCHFLTRLAAHE
jgi:hypothetical protein